MRAAIVALVLAIASLAIASPTEIDRLATAGDDARAIDAAVTAIERDAAAGPDDVVAAARACEDRLLDPARALRLYDRAIREAPDARIAAVASRRRDALAGELGSNDAYAAQAAELARLIAAAGAGGDDELADRDIERRGDALAAKPWPGARDAALWLAGWERAAGHDRQAAARYAQIAATATEPRVIGEARRGEAGCALDAGDWDRAESLARALPAASPTEELVRDDVLAAAARGRRRDRALVIARLVVLAAAVALALSLAASRRRPRRLIPDEIVFAGPIVAVLIAVAATAHRAIAPAVAIISGGGLALAWLSGLGLDALRDAGKPVLARTLAHAAICALGVVALGYLALMRDGLLDLLVETVRFGPES